MKTFSDYLRVREQDESGTDSRTDNGTGEESSGEASATRKKLGQIARLAAEKYPRSVVAMLNRLGGRDAAIQSALDDLKRSTTDSSLDGEEGLGNLGQGDGDEVVPATADSMNGNNGQDS